MAKKTVPKDPNDYPVLRLRVPTLEEFTAINKDVDEVRSQLLKNKVPNPYKKMWMKNHVILEAIGIGLKELRKRRRE